MLGIMHEGDSVAVRIMMELNVDPKKLYDEIFKIMGETNGGEENAKNARRSRLLGNRKNCHCIS